MQPPNLWEKYFFSGKNCKNVQTFYVKLVGMGLCITKLLILITIYGQI